MDLLKTLKALAEESRLRLVAILQAGGERPVNELASIMGQSQPRISHHLKALLEADIVERYPEGAFMFYRLSQGEAGKFTYHLLEKEDCLSELDQRSLENQITLQNQMAVNYFDKHAQEWERLREGQIDIVAIQNAILPFVKSHVKSPVNSQAPFKNFLDIGTGIGDMLLWLAPYFMKGEGVDLSRHMLDYARAKLGSNGLHHARVRQGDMHRMAYEAGEFDLVLMNMVLHFSDQPERALGEAARVLASNGYLLITDFSPHSHENLRQDQSHRRLGFEAQAIINMLAPYDLKLISNQTLSATPEDKAQTPPNPPSPISPSQKLPISMLIFYRP